MALARLVAPAAVALALLAHHGAGAPLSGPVHHGQGACAACDHGEHDPAGLVMACIAVAAAAIAGRPRPPGSLRMRLGPAAPCAPSRPAGVPQLRAPPPAPDLARLCVLLR
jgi:hypothetical protein